MLSLLQALFYIDNRKKYINDVVTGMRDSNRFKQDAKKIVTALGVSEVIYMIAKFTSIYLLLQSNVALYRIRSQCFKLFWQGDSLTATANLMIKTQSHSSEWTGYIRMRPHSLLFPQEIYRQRYPLY